MLLVLSATNRGPMASTSVMGYYCISMYRDFSNSQPVRPGYARRPVESAQPRQPAPQSRSFRRLRNFLIITVFISALGTAGAFWFLSQRSSGNQKVFAPTGASKAGFSLYYPSDLPGSLSV